MQQIKKIDAKRKCETTRHRIIFSFCLPACASCFNEISKKTYSAVDKKEVESSGSTLKFAAKAVDRFPRIFSQRCCRANLEKAKQWWNTEDSLLSALKLSPEKQLFLASRKSKGPAVQRTPIKSLSGGRRKRAQ